MGTFHSRIRIVIATLGFVTAAAVVVYARAVSKTLPMAYAEPLDGASNGLLVAAALYAINWVIAWVYRDSWPVTLTRCLIFAVIAYVGLSNLIDVFGENREVAWQIVGKDPAADPIALAGLRAQALCALGVMGLSAIAISLGFEPRKT